MRTSKATAGIRFEHCYASPLCGPSRALLMTGRYAFRTGMTGNDSGPLLKIGNQQSAIHKSFALYPFSP